MYVALDLASKTGVAWLREGCVTPSFRTWSLPYYEGDLGEPLERLSSRLTELHDYEPITQLFFEAPLLPRGRVAEDKRGKPIVQNFTRIESVALAFALAGHVEWFAKRIGAVCRQVQQNDWRKHWLGRGSGKTAELKKLSIARAKAMGWDVKSDHEADALGVLDYGLHCMKIDAPWRDERLFGGATR